MICKICGYDYEMLGQGCAHCLQSIGRQPLASLSSAQLEKQALTIISLCNSGRGNPALQEELKCIRNEQRSRRGRV